MKKKTYQIRYKLEVESGKFTKKDAKDPATGITDGLLILSHVEHPEEMGGGGSTMINSLTANMDTMTPDKAFSMWVDMGMILYQMAELSEIKRSLSRLPAELIFDAEKYQEILKQIGQIMEEKGPKVSPEQQFLCEGCQVNQATVQVDMLYKNKSEEKMVLCPECYEIFVDEAKKSKNAVNLDDQTDNGT